MKHYSMLLLALGLSSAAALAQNVTVVMKDGNSHKFNAEYLSEIYFREAAPVPDEVEFKSIDLDIYNGGNVTLTLTNEEGDVVCEADLYGSADATFLQAGTYEVDGSRNPFTVDPSWSSVKINGEKLDIESGELTVEYGVASQSPLLRMAAAEKEYRINVDFTLENGERLLGKYVGELPIYTPWISAELTGASYNVNPQPKGQFYVKFNDANWKYEMAMVFMADADATRLPAGTYTMSDFAAPGSLLPGCYVDGYNPNFNSTLLPGSEIIVSENNGTYDMTMNLNLSDGRKATFTFNGTISGTPEFESTEIEGVEYPTLTMNVYSGGNTTLMFYNSETTETVSLDCYGSSNASYFEPGIYVIGGSTRPYIDPAYIAYTYYQVGNGDKTKFKSGTLTVTREGTIYTFVLDARLDNAEETPIKMWHTGTLPKFGPELDLTMSAASYNVNSARPAGNFYVKFNDAIWNVEMALNMFADPSATLLPAGTYTYSTENVPGTFNQQSYVDIYNPHSNNRMLPGSVVTVSTEDQENYTFDMTLLFEDGRIATVTYEGQISGTPVFE